MLPVDDLGEPVVLDRPQRVVSLVPSITEAVAVSVPSCLVGATDYCTHPSSLDVARVGGSKYPDVGRVLELRPDLVLANSEENRPEDVDRLRAGGVQVWVTEAPATVPMALKSLRRLFATAWDLEPGWLVRAEDLWREAKPVRLTAVVPVWRRPWVVAGRDTFATDVLRRLGVENVYASHEERYPRPSLQELNERRPDLVVLPDEPYAFTHTDGPESFPGLPYALVNGRHLTWYGPSLVEARDSLEHALGYGRG
ncbi:ABC-type Fe3+-hydroxamate transport system, substrate-binding protein [Lentzea xinjiangensis]|uniref:ABC-type Fe3+-hydroxamate transport system, substrate-binding protein n=1 Tax=Lentzea xinjiangensis TaxID=402600 RepID=A0A1H9D5Q1_9PSEU|nr:helical backbone metal receptor [Lentzea xinjiangensis]SEQ08754.1 ABC-type Fe3+-hydroxamate transport system, substrate-binding protein [Lentzea xinjiangensis]